MEKVTEKKKIMILSLLRILREESDEQHRLHQTDMVRLIQDTTGLQTERGSIRRSLTTLQEAGFPVIYDHGWYYEHEFTEVELNLIIDSLLYNPVVPSNQCREIMEKLTGLGSQYYIPAQLQQWTKPYNPEFLHVLDTVHRALEERRQICFRYGSFDVDKKLHMRSNAQGQPRVFVVNPYRVIQSSGKFYLIANTEGHEGLSHYRLDRIQRVEMTRTRRKPAREVEGGSARSNRPRYLSERPHMFSGPAETYRIRAWRYLTGDILDWFGMGTTFENVTDEEVTAIVHVDEQSLRYWMKQYNEHAHLVEQDTGSVSMVRMDDSRIHILGRSVPGKSVRMYWTGSGLETLMDGSFLALEYESRYSMYEEWIRVEMDGSEMIRMPLEQGRHVITLIRGLTRGTFRHIRILKEVQPMEEDRDRSLVFHTIRTDGQLKAVEKHALQIECYGDSLTSGEGMAGPVGMMDWKSCIFSTKDHYLITVADHLKADFRLISQSGWGVVCGWDNHPLHTMKPLMDPVCAVSHGSPFLEKESQCTYMDEKWNPDFVVIHLGTNDAGARQQKPYTDLRGNRWKLGKRIYGDDEEVGEEIFQEAVADSVRMIREKYPAAKIIWAYGMCGTDMESSILEGIRRSGAEDVSYVALPPCAESEKGSRDHPGPASHRKAAACLEKHIRFLLTSSRGKEMREE